MHRGSVDLFLRPWGMEVATESSERCPLPVQVLEVSPRGHFWQLTVQPIGWHQEPIGVVLPEGNQPRYAAAVITSAASMRGCMPAINCCNLLR